MSCKRCLADPGALTAMTPMSYSTQLCEVCLAEWEKRVPEIMRAALDLFVTETPPPQVPSFKGVIYRIQPRES